MRPQRHDAFRTGAAVTLDRLELGAALLVRDAVNNRAQFAEGGTKLLPLPRGRRVRLRRAMARLLVTTGSVGRMAGVVLRTALHPRVLSAVREAWLCAWDLAKVLTVLLAGAAAIAAVIIVAAPPL